MKVLHTADLHYRDCDHDEIEKCVNHMIEIARQEQPNLIIIAGDITDSQNLKLDSRSAKTIVRQISEMADIAPVAIIIGTPSHDGKSAEILSFVRGEYDVHVSSGPEQIFLQGGNLVYHSGLNGDNPEAIISQIPTPTKQFLQTGAGIAESDGEIAQAMTSIFGHFGTIKDQFPDVPHILSGHFQVGGAFISETQQLIGRDIEISTDQLGMANTQVNCLGHIHLSQEMKNNTFYSGSIYRKDFGELESKGFFLHEINDGELKESRFIEVPTRKLVKASYDFINQKPVEFVFSSDIKGAHVKVEIKAYQDEAGQVNQAELERSLIDTHGAEKVTINLIRIPRVNVRAEKVLKLETLPDKVEEMARLRLEEVTPSILEKAAMLETMSPDEIIKSAGEITTTKQEELTMGRAA